MPRIRTIKPDFFTNEELGKLSPEARLLFIGLWTLADRVGRLEDRPIRIKAQLFPYDNWSVQLLLENLEQAELISRYEVDGQKCIQIINFTKHQHPHPKEAPFGLPPKPGNSTACREKVGTSREKVMTSRVDSHVLTMDYGERHERERARAREQISAFSIQECERYARSLKGIKSPAAYAKSIWRSGEDDSKIAAFVAQPEPPIPKPEISKPMSVPEIEENIRIFDSMEGQQDAADQFRAMLNAPKAES